MKHTFIPRITRLAAVCTLVVGLQSCYTYKIMPVKAQPSTLPQGRSKTYYSFFWGLMKPAVVAPANCTGLTNVGMADVTVTTNYGYSLISVLTLGIVNPVSLNWECAKALNVQ